MLDGVLPVTKTTNYAVDFSLIGRRVFQVAAPEYMARRASSMNSSDSRFVTESAELSRQLNSSTVNPKGFTNNMQVYMGDEDHAANYLTTSIERN
jgi:hypothetical protein